MNPNMFPNLTAILYKEKEDYGPPIFLTMSLNIAIEAWVNKEGIIQTTTFANVTEEDLKNKELLWALAFFQERSGKNVYLRLPEKTILKKFSLEE